jgi:hypothetical protein
MRAVADRPTELAINHAYTPLNSLMTFGGVQPRGGVQSVNFASMTCTSNGLNARVRLADKVNDGDSVSKSDAIST